MSTKMFGHPSMEINLVVKANQIIFTINLVKVKVVKNTETVGHVPRAIFPYITYILPNGGKVTVEVISSRQNRRGNGLDYGLCKVKDPYVATDKGHLLVKCYLRRNPVNFTNI